MDDLKRAREEARQAGLQHMYLRLDKEVDRTKVMVKETKRELVNAEGRFTKAIRVPRRPAHVEVT